MTRNCRWLALALALPVSAVSADPPTAIRGLVAKGKADSAQSKCTKWNAQSASADAALREACAEAFWVRADDVNTVEAWMAWREAWDGTKKAPEALEREAERAMFTVPVSGSEEQFLTLAKNYEGTKAGEQAKAKAANAAFLRVNSEEEALRVCEAYAGDPKLPELVQRYLGAFIEVRFDGKTNEVSLAECAVLPEGVTLTTNWVARDANNRFSSWNQTARDLLVQAGLPESFVDPMVAAAPEGKPAFPVCFDANAPDGLEVGLQISAGKGSTFLTAPYSAVCDEKAPPAFVVVEGGAVTAISLKAGHLVPVGSKADAEPGGYFPAKPGPPVLVDDAIVQLALPGLYVAQPLTGSKASWLLTSSQPMGAFVLPLGDGLKGSRLAGGWQLHSAGASNSVAGPGLNQAWVLPAGEARALSPLVQQVTGLNRDYAGFSVERAKPLPDPAQSPWTLPPPTAAAGEAAAAVAGSYGPAGAIGVPMTALNEYTRSNAAAGLAQVGLDLEVVRAWEVQLDADAPLETVWDATWGPKGMRLISDPLPNGLVRVFPFEVGSADVLSAAKVSAFAFTLDGATHVATATATGTGLNDVETYHLGAAGLQRSARRVAAPTAN